MFFEHQTCFSQSFVATGHYMELDQELLGGRNTKWCQFKLESRQERKADVIEIYLRKNGRIETDQIQKTKLNWSS